MHAHALCDDIIDKRPLVKLVAGAMEARDELMRQTGRDLPATLVYDHPTARAIAALLAAPFTGTGVHPLKHTS